jgi:uncharacterized membrane protein
MLGLTNLGVIHTAIALIAVAAALVCFFRDGGILVRNAIGRTYVIMTVLTCVTGFGIFQHGGFGKPHALGIITLVVLAIAAVAGKSQFFGKASRYIETVSYSLTVFFHMIPAIAESATPGAPAFDNPEAPELQAVTGAFCLVFLIGAAYQVWRLRSRRPALVAA